MDLTVFEYIEKDIVKRNLIHRDDQLLAMVSGGRDSVFMLYFLDYIRRIFHIGVSVFHLNHLIRGEEAYIDEEFTRNLSKKFSFPFYSEQIDVREKALKAGENLESMARRIRYDEARKIKEKLKCNFIVTAHTKTDYVETVILHLLRGDSIFGLLGIPYKNGDIVRPILSVNREQITNFLKNNNIEWRDDSTNEQTVYTRNYIRKVIIPHLIKIGGKSTDTKIMNSTAILREYVETARRCIDEKAKKMIGIKKDKFHLDLMSYFHLVYLHYFSRY